MSQPLAFPKSRIPISLWVAPVPVAPPSGAVIAAVLAFGDQREDREDGTTLVRFSPERLAIGDLDEMLGAELDRALDVSIIWDEREDEVVSVLDVAPLRAHDGAPIGNRYADARLRRGRKRPELLDIAA